MHITAVRKKVKLYEKAQTFRYLMPLGKHIYLEKFVISVEFADYFILFLRKIYI